jgi:hypothetical protein
MKGMKDRKRHEEWVSLRFVIPFMVFMFSCRKSSARVVEDAGLVEDVDDFAGEALELVVEVVGEVIDALVGAFDAAADFGEVLGLLEAELVELGAQLAQEFFEFLLERGAALEVVDDLEEDEEDGGERGGIDEPTGEVAGIGRGQFLGQDEVGREKEEVGEIHFECWICGGF